MKYLDMPRFDITEEATTTALHTKSIDRNVENTGEGKDPEATTRLLHQELEKELMDPPQDEDQALNLVQCNPLKDQLVESIVPPLEPHSKIPTLQQLLRDESSKNQLNHFILSSHRLLSLMPL